MSEQYKYIERIGSTAEIINRTITPDSVLNYLKRLQDPAPSTTVLHTRTLILKQLVAETGVSTDEFDVQFVGTRSPAVLMESIPLLWYSAHADTISYLFPKPTNEMSSALNQNSAHRPDIAREFPAAVMRWNEALQGYERISDGVIGSTWDEKKEVWKPFYNASVKPQQGFKPSDRVVYTPTLVLENGLVAGNMDNAAGLAACLAALNSLTEIANQRNVSLSDLGVGFVFPDSEEGIELDSAYFARGARQIIHRTPLDRLPRRIINVDGHDTKDPQPVSRLAAYVSGNKGSVVPPDVYAKFENFLTDLSPYGIVYRMTEEGASVSRSDDAGFMEVMDDLVPLGYDVRDPHFNDGQPTVNLDGLVQTAKAIAWIATEMTK